MASNDQGNNQEEEMNPFNPAKMIYSPRMENSLLANIITPTVSSIWLCLLRKKVFLRYFVFLVVDAFVII